MDEKLKRFLLRHRPALAGISLILILGILTLVTLVFREQENGPVIVPGLEGERPTLPDGTGEGLGSVAEPGAGQEREPGSARTGGGSPRKTSKKPQAVLDESRARPGELGATGRSLEESFGTVTGVADARSSTTILGAGSIRLDGKELSWSVHVIENGVTHVGLGIDLSPLGGTGQHWFVAQAPPHKPTDSFVVSGRATIEEDLASALTDRSSIQGEVAGFRVDGEERLLVAGSRSEIAILGE